MTRLCDCRSRAKRTDSVRTPGRTCNVYRSHVESMFTVVFLSATQEVETCPSLCQRRQKNYMQMSAQTHSKLPEESSTMLRNTCRMVS